LDTKVRLSTPYNGPAGTKLTLKRVINASDNDINFNNTKNILSAVSSDITGGTLSSDYTRINTGNFSPTFSAATHGLRKSDYIDIRANFGPSILNGLYRVEHIIDRYNFVIDLKVSNSPGATIPISVINRPPVRRLDGIPSDYYIRKFTLLTGNDYDVNKATSFGTSIYPKINDN
jgi:hypothetical protein